MDPEKVNAKTMFLIFNTIDRWNHLLKYLKTVKVLL